MWTRRERIGRTLALAVVALGWAAGSGAPAEAGERWRLELETGVASSGYNNIAIPGRTGTRFSFSEELRTDRTAFGRARLTFRLATRHHLGLLIAPLRLEAQGRVDRDVLFQETVFPSNAPLVGRFRFDSYRLTYRYDLKQTRRLELGLGLTVKVRSAAIGLEGAGLAAEKTNVGPVPLLHLRARFAFGARNALLLEADAAAAPQGRAEDVLLALERSVGRGLSLRAGYRLLEGGADNDQVYTFTLVHYAVLGLAFRF